MERLDSIYEPVLEALKLVDRTIEEVVEVEGGFISKLLGHVLKSGGKRMRPVITLLAGKFHNYNLNLLVPQAAAVEVLHTATLVHDDTIDRSKTRRGKATISAAWGDARAILLGDYLLAKAAELCAMTESARVVRLCAQTLMVISGGELEQSAFTFRLSEAKDQYYRWIEAKTAALFGMAAESGGILSGAPENEIAALREYGRNLGMAFQIVDDILDFAGNEAEMGKPTGEDLRQGVVTLPAILYLQKNYGDSIAKDVVKVLNKKDERMLKLLTKRVRESPFIGECFEIAANYSKLAREALGVMPDTGPKRNLMNLVDWALERKK
ncbi:MAG: polyprenyl synthetase family protein [Chloroflexota bacterium]